ncbi:hypothetical protein [Luteimonas sp. 3794]|uniref:L,D-transpeptidase family protein n=1 Tax=Luteimonas sp. 3794 TaxID=2817730 RepID=UPI00285F32CE|nr:hypothetical protein [Luteimonas sp. 3794]MDR6992492.1 L,D-peptidoglycan transpeptidase YkuD (ErfK/YbiS/YcfS/YnhG family) [Luteimonas sp. 3794]
MAPFHRRAGVTALLLASLLLAACATTPSTGASPVADAQQLIVVTADDWDAAQARMQRFGRAGDGAWRAVGDAVPVMLGRSGSGWGIGLHPPQHGEPQKQEGDGRAPAGVFGIGEAFGYAPTGVGALPYLPMQASHYCIDVPASPLYNRIVDAREVGAAAVDGSSERMRLDLHNDGDVRYRQGFVIEHNANGEAGRGSCIFAHLLRRPDETTAGCTAMSDAEMDTLLRWLDPARTPRFVLLPEPEYARLQTLWQLPALAQ